MNYGEEKSVDAILVRIGFKFAALHFIDIRDMIYDPSNDT